MSEKLAQLEKKGGISAIELIVEVSGAGSGNEKIGHLELTNDHKFSKMKVVEYINLSIQYNNWPLFKINGVDNWRPAVGTEFNITGLEVEVRCLTFDGNRTKTGVKIELS